jgi:hypothetical protein
MTQKGWSKPMMISRVAEATMVRVILILWVGGRVFVYCA